MKKYETTHLVKGEDLNHHGTLFAARAAAWLVEAAFAAAACEVGGTEGLVCRCLHEMNFHRPVHKGTILCLESRVVAAGYSSLMIFVRAYDAIEKVQAIESFFTFVTLDEATKSKRAHGITLDMAEDEQELLERDKARGIRS